MYTIFFTNFWYAHQDQFETLEAALEKAKRCGFDCTIRLNGEAIGAWSILSGWRKF
jgi:hypothetical protein